MLALGIYLIGFSLTGFIVYYQTKDRMAALAEAMFWPLSLIAATVLILVK